MAIKFLVKRDVNAHMCARARARLSAGLRNFLDPRPGFDNTQSVTSTLRARLAPAAGHEVGALHRCIEPRNAPVIGKQLASAGYAIRNEECALVSKKEVPDEKSRKRPVDFSIPGSNVNASSSKRQQEEHEEGRGGQTMSDQTQEPVAAQEEEEAKSKRKSDAATSTAEGHWAKTRLKTDFLTIAKGSKRMKEQK